MIATRYAFTRDLDEARCRSGTNHKTEDSQNLKGLPWSAHDNAAQETSRETESMTDMDKRTGLEFLFRVCHLAYFLLPEHCSDGGF